MKIPVLSGSLVASLIFFLLVASCPTFSEGFIEGFFDFVRGATTPLKQSPHDELLPQPKLKVTSRPSRRHRLNLTSPANSANQTNQTNPTNPPNPPRGFKTGTTGCYGELGCLEITPEWYHVIHRPINVLPEDRNIIKTNFTFFNRNHTSNPVEVIVDKENLTLSGFNPQMPVKFISHGFVDSGISSWPKDAAAAILKVVDSNVFVVNWNVGIEASYGQAAANARIVGLEIAHFIQFLEEHFEVKPTGCHCIGHSLGAHICGYAGEKMNGTLGRITGLDPAGPFFRELPPKVRLDPTDAVLVDVVHTDGGLDPKKGYEGFGMIEPCGHMDFYPNGGNSQLGCGVTHIPENVFTAPGFEKAKKNLEVCNHNRAVFFFIESFNTDCNFVAHICKDNQTYAQAGCTSCGKNNSDCAVMGLDADKYNIGKKSLVKFFLSTADKAPFCERHYVAEIKLARPALPEKADPWLHGQIQITLTGQESKVTDYPLDPIIDFKFYSDKTMKYVVPSPKHLGNVTGVTLTWKPTDIPGYVEQQKAACERVQGCNDKLYVSNVVVSNMDNMNSTVSAKASKQGMALCGDKDKKYVTIDSGSSATLQRNCLDV